MMKVIKTLNPLFLLYKLLEWDYSSYFAFRAAIDAAQSRMP
jgi:hypothetical protein